MLPEYAVQLVTVADIHLFEAVTAALADLWRDGFQVAGIGQLVEVDHAGRGVVDDVAHYS